MQFNPGARPCCTIETTMKIIFAQGNPGTQYARTRHNVGFMALDTLAHRLTADWGNDTKHKAVIATTTINGEKILLVKPLSFYNETGLVARSLIDFYKLDPARDFLVIHDELALPFGTIRIRKKGSDAGNNGIKSLNAHLGGEYARIRVGIWNEHRDRIDDAAFVLNAFTSEESAELQATIIPKITELIGQFCSGTLEDTSHTTGK